MFNNMYIQRSYKSKKSYKWFAATNCPSVSLEKRVWPFKMNGTSARKFARSARLDRWLDGPVQTPKQTLSWLPSTILYRITNKVITITLGNCSR